MENYYDVIIVGCGPSGMTSAIYTARAGMKTLILDKGVYGGLIVNSPEVRNIPGLLKVSGSDFADMMYEQVTDCGAEVHEFEEVTKIERSHDLITIKTGLDENYTSKVCIIATGTIPKVLGVKNESNLIGKNISFCVTCDGPMYKDKDVVVIGGGNSAVTEAIELADIAKSVTIVQNLANLTAEPYLVNMLASKINVTILCGYTVCEFATDMDKLSGVVIADNETAKNVSTIKCDGVFMAIGFRPNNVGLNDYLELSCGYIPVNEMCETNLKGIYSCGDCTYGNVKQVASACGQGAIAGSNAVRYIKNL